MILVVGLSPAWQRTWEFRALVPGKVNRASRVSETASGKGVNVARVARQLGANVRLLTVAGGKRGRLLAEALESATVVEVAAETRICQTLIAEGCATELVEESGRLMRREVADVLARFDREASRARIIVLSGSVPPGCGEDFYARLIKRTKVPVLVDVQGRQLLNAVSACPFAVKINRDELSAVKSVVGAEWLVTSNGAQGVISRHDNERSRFTPPRVKAVNTIGSGDAMLAGIAVALWRGQSMVEAIRFGIASGAANAMTARPGWVRRCDVARLLSRVREGRASPARSCIEL